MMALRPKAFRVVKWMILALGICILGTMIIIFARPLFWSPKVSIDLQEAFWFPAISPDSQRKRVSNTLLNCTINNTGKPVHIKSNGLNQLSLIVETQPKSQKYIRFYHSQSGMYPTSSSVKINAGSLSSKAWQQFDAENLTGTRVRINSEITREDWFEKTLIETLSKSKLIKSDSWQQTIKRHFQRSKTVNSQWLHLEQINPKKTPDSRLNHQPEWVRSIEVNSQNTAP